MLFERDAERPDPDGTMQGYLRYSRRKVLFIAGCVVLLVFLSVFTLGLGDTDPLRILEWNLRVRDSEETGKIRFGGSWLPTSEEYIGTMLGRGMFMVSHRDLGDGSELVVMRRQNSDSPSEFCRIRHETCL